MTKNDLLASVRDQVTTQDYSPTPKIEGVSFVDRREFADDGGTFQELARLTDGQLEEIKGFTLRQLNYSLLEPGAIKAFHLHYRQDELWFVPPSERLLLGLYDVRADSPTAGQSMRFVLGAHQPRLLFIPAGVAHGAANPYQRPMRVIYLANQQFNLKKPDEQRLPWDILGADFWSIKQG